MKTEKILQILTQYVSTLENGEIINRIVSRRQKTQDATPELSLANLMIDLREDIAAAGMKASGRGSILSAVKRILRVAVKRGASPDFHRAWTGKSGRQYVCNGYVGLSFSEPLDLPQADPDEGRDRSAVETQIDTTPADVAPVDLPPLAMVKTHIKLCKASGEYVSKDKSIGWDFGPGIGIVNAQYLADILEALPGARAASAPDTDITPFFFQDDEGNAGILCPIHPKDRPRERTADRYTTPAEDLPQVQPAEVEAPAATEPQETETTTPETTGEPKEPTAAGPAPMPAAENEEAAVARLNYATETARRAEEEARQQAERERVLNQRAEGRRYIERIAAEHPHAPGAPLVRICWSECPAFYNWDEGALTLSVAAADIILTHYDKETAAAGEHGYYKTKFVVEYTGPDGEPATYEGRYDLGDDGGGLVQHIRAFGEHLRDRGPYGNGSRREETAEEAAQILALADTLAAHLAPVETSRVSWAPWITKAAALSASPASTTTAPPSDDAADGEPGEDPAPDLDPRQHLRCGFPPH